MSRLRKYMSAILIAGMLCSGATNILTKKGQNGIKAQNASGVVVLFNHPWVQTLIMFTGETICLLVIGVQYLIYWRRKRESKNDSLVFSDTDLARNTPSLDDIPLPTSDEDPTAPKFKFSFIFLLPMFCDLGGTAFGSIGLLYTAASIWQMLRGSIIIFSGVLSMVFLKRRLGVHEWLGMCIVALGLGLVGSSSLLSNPADSKNTTVGILFILLGQFCNAVQMVVEEVFLKNRHYTPQNVVGMEGLFGMFIMFFFVLPGLYFVPATNQDFHDDLWDALVQIGHSGILAALVVVYLCSISVYNFCGLSIAKRMTTIHRTLVDASTTVLIWIIELITYYAGATNFGEGWSRWSWMEVGGFFLLFLGTCVYKAILKVPFVPTSVVGEGEGADEASQSDSDPYEDEGEDRVPSFKVRFATAEKALN